MYRLLTEDKDRAAILREIARNEVECTVVPAIGTWRGKTENSLIIELAGIPEFQAYKIAEDIKEMNGQETVIVQYIPSTETYI